MTTLHATTKAIDLHVHRDANALTIEWHPSGRHTYQSAWLRQYIGLEEFDDVASGWTDGANFSNQSWLGSQHHRIDAARVTDAGDVQVRWTDGSSVRLAGDFLWRQSFLADPVDGVREVLWRPGDAIPEHDFDGIMRDDDALQAVLHDYLAWGLVFVRDVPDTPGTVVAFAQRIATLCPSHLGDAFEVKQTDNPSHIGEVMAEIPLHIDLVYRQDPPTVQMLHVIRQIDRDGENQFVDVRRVVRDLREDDRRVLAETLVEFVADSETVHFRGSHPILRFEHDGSFAGVFYNQYKIIIPPGAPAAFYGAFERFREMIHSERYLYSVRLPESSITVFDNRRTLHGRSSFSDGARHLIGCFANADDLRSRFRVLSRRIGAAA